MPKFPVGREDWGSDSGRVRAASMLEVNQQDDFRFLCGRVPHKKSVRSGLVHTRCSSGLACCGYSQRLGSMGGAMQDGAFQALENRTDHGSIAITRFVNPKFLERQATVGKQ